MGKLVFKAIFLIVPLQLICACIYAQDNRTFLQKTVETLDKQSAVLPIEKAYLQTDKPIYAAGDTIWFKGYVTIGVLHRLSTKSGLLNIQLVNSRNSVVKHMKLELNNGMCNGTITLPDSLEAGAYQIRAYTNWMRNFGNDYFFQQDITIGNAITNNVFSKATYSYTHNAQGQLLNAGISYTDVSGSPYANKQVDYSIVKGAKTIYSAKGLTDDKGSLKINYQTADTSFFGQGIIRTNIRLDKGSVSKDISIKPNKKPVSVQFFPEGGYMVNGLQSNVAFKSIGNDGLGKDVTGVVVDNDNKEVAQISSSHLGMGKFTFTPQSGKTYKAKIGESIINLPSARNQGYIMAVENRDTSKLIIAITGTDTTGKLNFIARSGGLACYAAAVKMSGNGVIIRIPKNKLPSGVAQFTLFSASGEPLNERMAFISHREELLNLKVSVDKNSYQSREKVNINLNAQDVNHKPVSGSFSAAVVNGSGIEGAEKDESSILSAILLTSGIKGNIEEPAYYFNEIDSKTQADLDLLMLTQGYRGFEWKEITGGKIQEAAYIPEKSLAISGTLKTPGGKPIAKGKVRLFTTTGPLVMVDTLTDEQGRFTFNEMWFKDGTRFVLQATTSKDRSNVIIEINNPDKLAFTTPANYLTAENDSVSLAYLQNSKKRYQQDLQYNPGGHTILLKEVEVKEDKTAPHSSNLGGAGHYSQIILAKEMESCTTLATCLIPRLHGIVVDRDGIPHAPQSKTFTTTTAANGTLVITPSDVPMVMLDGVEINVPAGNSPFDVINPSDVSSVEVLFDPADLVIYGIRGNAGIIMINTKHGNEVAPRISASNVLSFMPKGFYMARKFYSPEYTAVGTNQKPDLRSTIFWKPDVSTDLKGNSSFSYFNADGKGTYRVVIEGIDDDGNIGRQVFRYEVN